MHREGQHVSQSVAFTLDVYAKVSREWQQGAVARVEAFLQRAG